MQTASSFSSVNSRGAAALLSHAPGQEAEKVGVPAQRASSGQRQCLRHGDLRHRVRQQAARPQRAVPSLHARPGAQQAVLDARAVHAQHHVAHVVPHVETHQHQVGLQAGPFALQQQRLVVGAHVHLAGVDHFHLQAGQQPFEACEVRLPFGNAQAEREGVAQAQDAERIAVGHDLGAAEAERVGGHGHVVLGHADAAAVVRNVAQAHHRILAEGVFHEEVLRSDHAQPRLQHDECERHRAQGQRIRRDRRPGRLTLRPRCTCPTTGRTRRWRTVRGRGRPGRGGARRAVAG